MNGVVIVRYFFFTTVLPICRATNIFYRYSIAPGAFPVVAALTFSKAPAAGPNA
jgi:hypothetical protein